jgi:hypothetical protein
LSNSHALRLARRHRRRCRNRRCGRRRVPCPWELRIHSGNGTSSSPTYASDEGSIDTNPNRLSSLTSIVLELEQLLSENTGWRYRLGGLEPEPCLSALLHESLDARRKIRWLAVGGRHLLRHRWLCLCTQLLLYLLLLKQELLFLLLSHRWLLLRLLLLLLLLVMLLQLHLLQL